MKLHVNANVLREAPSEEMGLLIWSEAVGVRHSRLIGLLVSHNGGRERQASQFRQVVGAEGRPETLMA